MTEIPYQIDPSAVPGSVQELLRLWRYGIDDEDLGEMSFEDLKALISLVLLNGICDDAGWGAFLPEAGT